MIAISKLIELDEDFPIRKLDKVLFDPREAVPVEFEADNRLFVVPLEKVLAIFPEGGGGGGRRFKETNDQWPS